MKNIDFSQIYHQKSKQHEMIPADSSLWPEEWKTIYYKTYPRLPKIKLEHKEINFDLFRALKNRASRREFTRESLAKEEISLLLKYSCGINGTLPGSGDSKRVQPSGGARFPIEMYPVIFRSGGEFKAGLYHYDVKNHQLDVLWRRDFADEDIMNLFNYSQMKEAAAALVMTAVFSRTQNKYGERGYRYILLEAGHIGQNIHLVCEALNLKCFALGGTKDENLEKLIDIDGVTESVIYAFAVGK